MPQFNVYFRDPQNPKRANPKPVPYEGDDPQSLVQQIMVHEGQTPVWVQPIGAPQGAPTAPQAAPQAPLPTGTAPPLNGAVPTPPAGSPDPDQRANTLGMIGQIGLPILGRMLLGKEGALLGAALGMGGGLAGSALGRGGLPTMGDVKSTALGEGVGLAGRAIAQAARLPPVARALGSRFPRAEAILNRGVSGAAREAKIPLTAGQRFPEAVQSGWLGAGKEVPADVMAREESAAGQAVLKASRETLKSIPADPVKNAHQLLKGVQDFAAGIEDDVARDSFKRSLMGIDKRFNIDKMSAQQLRSLAAESPLAVRQFFRTANMFGRKAVETPEVDTARLWLTDALHGSTKPPIASGQFQSGRTMVDLDGRAFKDMWRSLKPVEHAAFGPMAKGMEHLVRAIDTFPAADRGRIAMPWFRVALHKSPWIAFAAGAIGVGEYTSGSMLSAFTDYPIATAGAGALTATLLGSVKGTRLLLNRFLSTEAGSQWVAAGLAAQARGIPEAMIVEGLTRAAGRKALGGTPQMGGASSPTSTPSLPPLGPNTALAQ